MVFSILVPEAPNLCPKFLKTNPLLVTSHQYLPVGMSKKIPSTIQLTAHQLYDNFPRMIQEFRAP